MYNSGACTLSVMGFLFLMGTDGPVEVLKMFGFVFPQVFFFFGNNNVGWEARGALQRFSAWYEGFHKTLFS